jgi:hypothetical protein
VLQFEGRAEPWQGPARPGGGAKARARWGRTYTFPPFRLFSSTRNYCKFGDSSLVLTGSLAFCKDVHKLIACVSLCTRYIRFAMGCRRV